MSDSAAPIDILVPVYRGLQATRRCLESVLAGRCVTPFELIVVDDASPEPDLSAWLDTLAAAGRIQLLRNRENLGFVASVNLGMRVHPERDAVLLNSDTEVAGDWLDRLAACAARDPRIGTITPFSNNGSICSYPNMLEVNALPAGWTLAELDAVFAGANAGRCGDLPTGVGFCMQVRRACWQAVGEFDAGRFGKGYGEECDFSRRAAKAGWRNVVCADVFVYHQGALSFGAERGGLMASAEAVMAELHPEYPGLVREFLRADPLRTLRDNVTRARRARPGDGALIDELIAERESRAAWLGERLAEREREVAALRAALAAPAAAGDGGGGRIAPAGHAGTGTSGCAAALDAPYGGVLAEFLAYTEVRVRRAQRLGTAGRRAALAALRAVRWLARRLIG